MSGTCGEFVAESAEGGDRPSTLEDHIAWMKIAGRAACCLHVYGDRSLAEAVRVEKGMVRARPLLRIERLPRRIERTRDG